MTADAVVNDAAVAVISVATVAVVDFFADKKLKNSKHFTYIIKKIFLIIAIR